MCVYASGCGVAGHAHLSFTATHPPSLPRLLPGLMPRVVVAASYVKMGRAKMELLWDGELKANTVHVYDVARALYFLARKGEATRSAWRARWRRRGAGRRERRE